MSLKDATETLNENLMRERMFAKALENGVDFKAIKEELEVRTYMLLPHTDVPLHEHAVQNEIFYCIKGKGIGIVDDQRIAFSPGDVFMAPAGSLHSVESNETLYLLAFLVPVNRIICHCKQVSYKDIRQAMMAGARTVEDIQEMTGAGTGCGKCIKNIEKILSMACGCKMVTVKEVMDLARTGTSDLDHVLKITGAGNDCGKCKMLIQSIIDDASNKVES